MKTEQQIRDYLAEQKRWFKLMDGADSEFRLVEGMVEALEFVLDRNNEQPEPVLATRHNDNEVIDVTLTEDIAFEEGFEQGKLAQKKYDELPDGLLKYMDGVALNFLYRNYHKATNGLWSRAEVFDHWEKDGDVPEVWDVTIDFGCQDDTGGSSYRVTMYFFKKDGEWTCDDVSPTDADSQEDPADRDDRLYHEEQDHIAMEKAKVDQKVHNHPLGTGFAHKDKETK